MGDSNKAMGNPNTDPSITTAAQELVERLGGAAAEGAQQRVDAFGINGSSLEHDKALLVLSAVERLLKKPVIGEFD